MTLRAAALVLIALLCVAITRHASAQDRAVAEDAAFVLFVGGKRDEAYLQLAKLALDPGASGRVFLYKGVIERDRKDLDAAIASFQAGHTREPSDMSLMLELAATLSWRGDLQDAQRMYELALQQEPNNAPAAAGRARMLAWQGEDDEARDGFNALLARDPSNQEARDGLKALDDQRHTHALAWGGVLDTNAATVDAIFGATLAHDFSPSFTGQLGYRSEGVEMARDLSLVGSKARSIVHKASAIAIWRPAVRLTLNGGYEATFSDAGLYHAFDVGAGLKLGEAVTVIGGVRFYAQQGFGMLDHVGVIFSHMRDSYFMVQGFRYDDYVRDHSQSGVLTLRQAIGTSLALKLGGGYGFHTRTGTQKTALAGVEVGITRDLHVGVEYQYFTANFFRHQATASVGYDFP